MKLEDDLDSLKKYLHTENGAASIRHSKLRALTDNKSKLCFKVKCQNVKSSELFRALS